MAAGVGFLGALGAVGRALIPPGPETPPPPFKIFSPGYTFEPQYCRYFAMTPPIPKGMRAHITIEGNENPTGSIEVFVTPESSNWDPSVSPRPPGDPKTNMNGNGRTSAVGPGVLTIHLNTDRKPPRVEVEIDK
jgi:hypothetical protein